MRLIKLGQRAANAHISYDRPVTPVAHVIAFPNIFKWGAYVGETNTLYPEQMAHTTRRKHRIPKSALAIGYDLTDSRDHVSPAVFF